MTVFYLTLGSVSIHSHKKNRGVINETKVEFNCNSEFNLIFSCH